MKITGRLVISLVAESKEEAINLAKTLWEMQETTAAAQAAGAPLTMPPETDVRFLVKPGVWDRG